MPKQQACALVQASRPVEGRPRSSSAARVAGASPSAPFPQAEDLRRGVATHPVLGQAGHEVLVRLARKRDRPPADLAEGRCPLGAGRLRVMAHQVAAQVDGVGREDLAAEQIGGVVAAEVGERAVSVDGEGERPCLGYRLALVEDVLQEHGQLDEVERDPGLLQECFQRCHFVGHRALLRGELDAQADDLLHAGLLRRPQVHAADVDSSVDRRHHQHGVGTGQRLCQRDGIRRLPVTELHIDVAHGAAGDPGFGDGQAQRQLRCVGGKSAQCVVADLEEVAGRPEHGDHLRRVRHRAHQLSVLVGSLYRSTGLTEFEW